MTSFMVSYQITGSSSQLIEADSEEAARAIAEANCDDDNWDPDLEDISDVDFTIAQLHTVIRDGKRVQTSYVRATDQPVSD